MEKYIVWHIQGGLGKNIAATSLLSSLKEKYSDRKIVVVASYPEVFLNNDSIYRVYKLGNTQYFYDDYIKDKDTIIFRHEPYYQSNHIHKKSHLIENWADLLGIDYKNQTPVLNLNLPQKRSSNKWYREKPILVIQTNGGAFNSKQPYSWTRDIPFDVSQSLVKKFERTHHIIQICKPSSRQLSGVEVVNDELSSNDLFSILLVSDKRILIDSCLQHASSALGLKSNVIWIGTSPKNFGYDLHNNIVANLPSDTVKLIDSYLFDYSFEGINHECPYMSISEMFDVDKLVSSII
jgi:hypothetical protein